MLVKLVLLLAVFVCLCVSPHKKTKITYQKLM